MKNEKQRELEVLEDVRDVHLRKNPRTGKLEVLFLEKEIEGVRRLELPGGAVFKSRERFEEFQNSDLKERQKMIQETVFSKMLEKTGIDLKEVIGNQKRRELAEKINDINKSFLAIINDVVNDGLLFLGKHSSDLELRDDKYLNLDGIEFNKRNTTFVITLQDNPNVNIDLSKAGEKYKRFEWYPLEDFAEIVGDESLIKDFFKGKDREFARNSDVTKLARSVIPRITARVLRNLEGEDYRKTVKDIKNNGSVESIGYKNDKITMMDIQKPELLKGPARKALFEKEFGKLEPSYKVEKDPKARENNEKILKQFSWTLNKTFKYFEEHKKNYFSAELIQKFPLNSTKDIINFLNGFGEKKFFKDVLRIFKVAVAYNHFDKSAEYYFRGEKRIDQHEEKFSKDFDTVAKKIKRKINFRIYNSFTANTKIEYRIIDKLLTKSTTEFKHVPDVFRGMYVCDEGNYDELISNIKSEFNKLLKISMKNKVSTNKGRGMKTTRYLVGKYPIIDVVDGKEKKFEVPFEIQIISPEELKKAKVEGKNYEVYHTKGQLVRDTKLDQGISQEEKDRRVKELAQKPLVQDKKHLDVSRNRRAKNTMNGYYLSDRVVGKTEKMIKEEYKKTIFKNSEGKFIAYQEVIRLWGNPLGNRQWENDMVNVLNRRTHISLKKEEWTMFFKNPQKFVNETIYELEENNLSMEKVIKRVIDFAGIVATIPGIEINMKEVRNKAKARLNSREIF